MNKPLSPKEPLRLPALCRPAYDATGSYRPNAISTDQPNFYNQTSQHLIPVDADPYSQQVFENSPLQRVLQAGQVGAGFQPGQHFKTVSYRYNESGDGSILVWAWNSATSSYTTTANYAANTLAVTDGVDEDGIETQVFTDLAGHTILKRQILSPANLDTYYIYNNQGMIALIIPPKAMAIMNASHNYDPTQTGVVQLTFNYTYDRFDRLTQKMLPGFLKVTIIPACRQAGTIPLNRPVLIQDNNLAANFEWNYIKYDVKGRAVSQGIYTDSRCA